MVISVAIAITCTVGFTLVRLANPAPPVPTAEVKRGEFVEYVQLRGETKALKSLSVNAPFKAGDLQIIKLIQNGTPVKKGDVVVRFDITKLEQDLAQSRSALKTAEAEIEQARSQDRLKEEQDLTDVMKARYDVAAAKLDAGKQEILSRIEGEEAKLKVADAEQKLREAEEKLKSDSAAGAADLESKTQKRDKALFDVRQTERSIAAMTLRAPGDGTVTLLRNWHAGWMGGPPAEFREGDRAWPGAAIADLPDLSTIRVAVRVDETDRSRLKSGEIAMVRVDAVPDREFWGRVAKISPLATTDFSGGWPFPRNFNLEIELEQSDPRLRAGMTALTRVMVDRLPDSILIPPQASFEKLGRAVAYVLRGPDFEERVIEVARRSEDQLLISVGLRAGERVALKDPTEVRAP
jgi:RND family efflux transporter MFP subunit